jgi:hypothetical protein
MMKTSFEFHEAKEFTQFLAQRNETAAPADRQHPVFFRSDQEKKGVIFEYMTLNNDILCIFNAESEAVAAGVAEELRGKGYMVYKGDVVLIY